MNSDFAPGSYLLIPAGGVTTTNEGKHLVAWWWGGPGVNATTHYEIMQDASIAARYLRMQWLSPGTKGAEMEYPGTNRYTTLEVYYWPLNQDYSLDLDEKVRQFYGKTVEISFDARVAAGSLNLIPIVWQSWNSSGGERGVHYDIYEASGQTGVVKVARDVSNASAPVTVTAQWQHFTKRIFVADKTGMSLTTYAYTAFGLDFDELYGPTLDIANFTARIVD